MFKMRPKMAKMRTKMTKIRAKMTKRRPKMAKMRPKIAKPFKTKQLVFVGFCRPGRPPRRFEHGQDGAQHEAQDGQDET